MKYQTFVIANGLTETKLFHFYKIFKNEWGKGVGVGSSKPPLELSRNFVSCQRKIKFSLNLREMSGNFSASGMKENNF